MIKYLIFDFDGTLADTISGIQIALNNTSEKFKLNKIFSISDCKNLIGGGAKRLFLKAFDYENLNKNNNKIFKYFMKTYLKEQNTNFVLYKEVYEILYKIQNQYNLIIYSNKPEKILKNCIRNSLNGIKFFKIIGNNKKYLPKPDTTYMNYIINKYKINKDECIYVGDSKYDVEFAKNLNIISIILEYGYGDYNNIRCDYLISNFSDILNIIKKLK